MPSTRSSTKQNERVCEPSPYTVMGWPLRAWLMNAGSARPPFTPLRGPYVLKMRTMPVRPFR